MNDDAIDAPSPLWVRVSRSVSCFAVAAAVAWRGLDYDDPYSSAAVPFVMCALSALVLSLLGLMCLEHNREPGPT